MLSVLKILVTCRLLAVAVESRRASILWNFKREITVHGKVIIPASPMLTETESFMYAVCENRNSLAEFIETRCNITVEKPILSNIARKVVCPIDIKPDSLVGNELLKRLSLTSVGEDKAIISWLQDNNGLTLPKLKVVNMANCQIRDVPIPVEKIRFIVAYGRGLDVVLQSSDYCNALMCKVTLNSDGQLAGEPTDISYTNNATDDYSALGPVTEGSIDKGFYLVHRFTGYRAHLFRVGAKGNTKQVTTFSTEKPYGSSTNYGFLTLCDSFTDTIACRTYNSDSDWTMDRTIEFQDKGMPRWLKPYNLQDGAVLLLTGLASGESAQQFDHFSVYRLEANGQKHRKRLEIEHLNFECESARDLRVHVTENELDQICFYFSCVHRQLDMHKYQFAFKCYPKSYFHAHVPLTNACFIAIGVEAINDITIYA